MQDILEFRQAISHLTIVHPFSTAFGPADSRKNCLASASRLFHGLLSLQNEKNFLKFRTLGELAINPNGPNGSIDPAKLQRLVQLLRPNKEMVIDAICFARSVDKVYRELKMLVAGIRNASAGKLNYFVPSTRYRPCALMLTLCFYIF